MNRVKCLSLTTSFFLAMSSLVVDAAIKPNLTKEEISSTDDQLKTDLHSHHSHSHRDHSNQPLFLYASTPLDYVGQNVGTGPVPSGTTVSINFPLIGDTSEIPPVSENNPGIFTVLKSGQYLINWNVLVKNLDSGGLNTAFEIVLLKNGSPQPPNLKFNIPPAFGKNNNPSGESLSGSILLKLKVGDIVQLHITSLSSSALPIPLVVGAAAINFVRISKS